MGCQTINVDFVSHLISPFCDGEDVWPTLIPPFADVQLHGAESVDGEPLVWVDGNTEQARVGVDQLVLVPHNRVPKNTGIPKVGKVSHVCCAVIDRWVHLTHLVLLEDLLLLADHHGGLLAILGLEQAFQVAAFSLI